MSVTGAMIVKQARGYKGKTEVPAGSNTGPFVIACQRATFLAGTGWPWCAAFVCYVCKELGVPLAYNGAGAHDLADHHPPAVPVSEWAPGMVVDYGIGAGHTGILVSHTADTVTSVDGNWSDSVIEHTLPLSDVRKVWKIPGVSYGSAAPTQQPTQTKQPRWVVTTGASGSKRLFRHKKGLIRFLQSHTFPKGITIKKGAR